MTYRVVVWGTGNAGRPAIRAVAAHTDLELAGVVVSNPAKVGRDAGELAYLPPLGVAATDDTSVALADDVDAVVYTATADTRPDDAFADLIACLEAGADVVSTSFYPLLHPASAPPPMVEAVERACATGDTSVFVSGIDPGWALDILPVLLSGVCAGIEEIRVQEIFNYALYDAPDVVRDVIGFGGPMDSTPLMLLDVALEMVWAPMVRILAEALDGRARRRDARTSSGDRSSGRSTCRGWAPSRRGRRARSGSRCRASSPVTRGSWSSTSPASTTTAHPSGPRRRHRAASTACASRGHPNLDVTIHGTEPGEPGAAGGGNATAANRIVNAIPAVCDAPAGPLSVLDLPPITGAAQLRR